MEKHVLKNGMVLIHEPRKSDSVAIQVTVKIGSNHEPERLLGVSHFLEHVLFEGTKKRPSSKIIANEIEKYGGEFNAYTSEDKTAYHIKIISKHFDVALDILADMMQNSLFRRKDIERERKVILEEIKMVHDDPKNYRWVFFEKTMYYDHPMRHATSGSIKTVKAIKRQEIIDYFNQHYVAKNMAVIVTGPVDGIKNKVEKAFSSLNLSQHMIQREFPIGEMNNPRKEVEKRSLQNSYIILGYNTARRTDFDSYVLDVMKAYLGKGQSGKLFYEIRTKRALAYEVGVNHNAAYDFGYFAVYLSTDKKNIAKAEKVVLNVLKSASRMTELDLTEAKEFISGTITLSEEDTYNKTDALSFWYSLGDKECGEEYLKNILKVTLKDIQRVVKKYFRNNHVVTVLEQKN